VRAVLLAALLAPALAPAAGVERFQSYLRGTQTARADFEQKVFDRERKLVQESKGSFSFLRPGRFRWNYAQPYPQLIVGDGERVWIYDRDLNQVTVRKISKALGSTPAALLAGASDIDKAFDLSDGGDRDGRRHATHDRAARDVSDHMCEQRGRDEREDDGGVRPHRQRENRGEQQRRIDRVREPIHRPDPQDEARRRCDDVRAPGPE